jgi:hypothetical protein
VSDEAARNAVNAKRIRRGEAQPFCSFLLVGCGFAKRCTSNSLQSGLQLPTRFAISCTFTISLVDSPPVLANGGVENEARGGRGPRSAERSSGVQLTILVQIDHTNMQP